MKKLNLLFVMFALFAAVSFVSSCSKDSTTADLKVTVNEDTSVTPTYLANSTVKYTIDVISGEKIKTLTVVTSSPSKGISTPVDLLGSTSPGTGFSTTYTYSIGTETVGSVITLTFTATDAGGRTTPITKTITVKSGTPVVTATTPHFYAALLGGQGNSNDGSFYSTSNNTVYNIAPAATNSEKIDFLYYYSTSASIYSPAYAATNSLLGVDGWATKNATKLVADLTSSVSDWTKVSNEIIGSIVAPTSTNSTITGLTEGKIFGFVTAAGVKGLVKVISITTGASGKINLEVKVVDPSGAVMAK